MAIIASGERGTSAPSHKGNSGPGTDAVQEETGELDYHPIFDIIFHEDTVPNFRCLLRTGRIEGIKIGRVWVGSTALVGGHTWVLGASNSPVARRLDSAPGEELTAWRT